MAAPNSSFAGGSLAGVSLAGSFGVVSTFFALAARGAATVLVCLWIDLAAADPQTKSSNT